MKKLMKHLKDEETTEATDEEVDESSKDEEVDEAKDEEVDEALQKMKKQKKVLTQTSLK